MSNPDSGLPLAQKFRNQATLEVISIAARFDKKTDQHVILWKEIQRAFENAKRITYNGHLVSFLMDDDFEEVEKGASAPLETSSPPQDIVGYIPSASEGSIDVAVKLQYGAKLIQ
ncbi:hypothetical protein BC939DRAFT_505577 [Gamsiella multidivaricata]|uniref:uncharacterized protein n=1 Tax=Gamsiella multidivaricata TaxID=101098 RepID=UPI00221EA8B5|nr:uncharacterized protein BC939DRAFT_505577 [Gamsiella multidivaricata]KAI7819571.1 hypothetical protein BC939DRAFT_505577 [Gamsiella multidivaricata]